MAQDSLSARGRRLSMTACAVMMAASLGGESLGSPAEINAVEQIERYCQTSWRNAQITQQDWGDCTQEAFAELLQRISPDDLGTAIRHAGSPQRRELNRSIWCTVQRWRRSPRFYSLDVSRAAERNGTEPDDEVRLSEILEANGDVLSLRQRRILQECSRGASISEIASQMQISAARVSDEKYKAVQKLRRLYS